jgi:predicted negative regulator of RcsB-dependent stress response
LAARPKPEQEPLRIALDAAAVLHWFGEGLLVKILDIPNDGARKRFEELRALPFVEDYLRNVHESTRLGWRKQLAHEQPEHFARLSAKAAACFASDVSIVGRVEWIYHLLCGDPERGATELEVLDRNWSNCARPEDRYALSAALRELEDTRLVQGRARVWVLLVTAWTRVSRGEVTQLADVATKILDLARAVKDPRAESDAQCLFGGVLEAQGKLEAAQKAFGEGLAISRRLAEQNPSNAGWQRDLAVAHSRVGDVLKAQGKLEAARKAFGEGLAISRRLAEQDPNNTGWQRDLAVAHSRVGEVLQAQGKLQEAQKTYDRYLSISRRLTEQNPSNIGCSGTWGRRIAG